MSSSMPDSVTISNSLATLVQTNAAAESSPSMQQALAFIEKMDIAELKRLRGRANKKLSGVCYFLDVLPEELRVQIYEHTRKACKDSGSPERIIIDWYHFEQPGLLATCKEIRAVASPIYYDKNKFLVNCYPLDPSIIIAFSQHAIKGSSKPFAIDIAIDHMTQKLNSEGLMRWARAHYDGVVIRCPAADPPSETEDWGQDEYGFIGSLFNIVASGKKRGYKWADIEKDLEEMIRGSYWLIPW